MLPSTSSAIVRAPVRTYSSRNNDRDSNHRQYAVFATLVGGIVTLAHLTNQDKTSFFRPESLLPASCLKMAECAGSGFSDPNLTGFVDKVNEGID